MPQLWRKPVLQRHERGSWVWFFISCIDRIDIQGFNYVFFFIDLSRLWNSGFWLLACLNMLMWVFTFGDANWLTQMSKVDNDEYIGNLRKSALLKAWDMQGVSGWHEVRIREKAPPHKWDIHWHFHLSLNCCVLAICTDGHLACPRPNSHTLDQSFHDPRVCVRKRWMNPLELRCIARPSYLKINWVSFRVREMCRTSFLWMNAT